MSPATSNRRSEPGPEPSESLRALEDRFIERIGELSAIWGTTRSMGRIHALLYLSPRPLSSDEIGERLAISHGNCSTSLRQLLIYGPVRRVHSRGERKARFVAVAEPWAWLRSTTRVRRDRELLPQIEGIREIRSEAEDALARARGERRAEVEAMLAKIDLVGGFLDEVRDLVNAFLALDKDSLSARVSELRALLGVAADGPPKRTAARR